MRVEVEHTMTFSTTVVLPDPGVQFVECAECGDRFENYELAHGKIPYHFPGKISTEVCEGSHQAPRLIAQ